MGIDMKANISMIRKMVKGNIYGKPEIAITDSFKTIIGMGMEKCIGETANFTKATGLMASKQTKFLN